MSLFFLSLEDDLMRLFGSDRIAKIMDRTGAEEGEVITHPLVTRAIEGAQKRVEYQNFQARKRLLDYDDVMNQQREVVYSLRLFALEGGEELKAEAQRMMHDALEQFVDEFSEELPEQWDRDLMAGELLMKYFISAPDLRDPDKVPDAEALEALVTTAWHEAFEAKLRSWDELGARHGSSDLPDRLLSHVMLQVLDEKWKDHLFELDHLRTGIQYRAWGQKDPLIEYKREAFEMFVGLMQDIKSTFTERFLKFQVQITGGAPQAPRRQALSPESLKTEGPSESDLMVGRPAATVGPGGPVAPKRELLTNRGDAGPQQPQKRTVPKVGRNDPCPCGSGKKYKKCHGAAA
jgi:preprotein translocase subunit SecA